MWNAVGAAVTTKVFELDNDEADEKLRAARRSTKSNEQEVARVKRDGAGFMRAAHLGLGTMAPIVGPQGRTGRAGLFRAR